LIAIPRLIFVTSQVLIEMFPLSERKGFLSQEMVAAQIDFIGEAIKSNEVTESPPPFCGTALPPPQPPLRC